MEACDWCREGLVGGAVLFCCKKQYHLGCWKKHQEYVHGAPCEHQEDNKC